METESGSALLTAAQMRAIEGRAMDAGDVTGLELMERAGRGVVAALFDTWPELAAAPHRALILCGPGNNGGDGFVIARLLDDWGWEPEVVLFGEPDRLPPDAAANHARWCERGAVRPVPDRGLPIAAGTAVVVDALFGTGLARPVTGEPLERALRDMADCVATGAGLAVEERIARAAPLVVAVDIPSGLCADSGRVLDAGGTHPSGRGAACGGADLTVSFHRAKPGHLLAEGPALCGRLRVADIGLGDVRDPGHAVRVGQPSRAVIAKGEGHKYSHGHALVLSGPMGRSGAARLAARAALRVGAGLVTVGAPGDAMAECAAQLTAIMLRQVDGAPDLAALLSDDRITAICLGPGMGTGQRTREMVAAALGAAGSAVAGRPGRGVVLDADALTAFAEAPEALLERLDAACVLTPHMGEFARLFPDLTGWLAAPPARGPAFSKVDAARAAAERAGCVVLLKGMDTVIAAPDGAVSVHSAAHGRAAPWLATAGAGDVLAGLIAGLIARGTDAHRAAACAAWLHVEAARAAGPGLIAEDLPETLPSVFRRLFERDGAGHGSDRRAP
jgi:hydroxyethylthiazole kinase-like uncharacterized protein yjeF